MTALPIVERELRIAARRSFTYYIRLGASSFMLLIFFSTLLMFSMGGAPWSVGQMQFTALKWIAFAFACGTGIFLTSDSLSEEKREGTLGLLFLTDLRGYDIVLGKLMSHSLQAFYSLLAAFPILALPLLLGGVTGTEFSRSLLVIGNTLFLSLAIGIFISSISREVMKAMNGALLIILVLLIGLPWFDLGLAHWEEMKFKAVTSIFSPGHLFVVEGNMRGEFWQHLGIQHLLAWSFLAAAAICIPRAWQEKTASAKGPRRSVIQWWRYGGGKTRLAFRRKFLARDPIQWLALRDRWMTRLVWLALLVAVACVGVDTYTYGFPTVIYDALSTVHAFLTLGMFLWVASQASRMFVDGIRSGAMELILVTPVTVRQIVSGQWRAMCRTFWLPVLVMLTIEMVEGFHTIRTYYRGSTVVSPMSDITYQWISTMVTTLTILGDLIATGWFGMWMGVTSRKTSAAVLKTLCFVVALPWLGQIFLWSYGMMASTRFHLPFWTGNLAGGIFELVKNILFIVIARNLLRKHFGERVARGHQNLISRPRRRIRRPSVAAPPVIT